MTHKRLRRNLNISSIVSYAFDAGSPINSWGWGRVEFTHSNRLTCQGGTKIQDFIDLINQDIRNEKTITIGVEAPVFMPIPSNDTGLSKSRNGDGRYHSSFGRVGGYVGWIGIQQLSYLLSKLNIQGLSPVINFNSWNPSSSSSILLWEAFVSGVAKNQYHHEDAITACVEIMRQIRSKNIRTSVVHNNNLRSSTFNSIGAAILVSGWSNSNSFLGEEEVLVIKPPRPYLGWYTYHEWD